MSLTADPDEYLETGHELGTPDGDNLLLDGIRGMFAAYADLATNRSGRAETHGSLGLCDAMSPVPFANWAITLAPLSADEAPEAVRTARAFFAGAGVPWMFCSAWPIIDLSALGLHRIGHPPFMVRFPGGELPAAPNALRVVEVDSPKLAAAFEQTIAEAYPIDQVLGVDNAVLPLEFPGSDWRFFVAYEGDRAVGTSAGWIGPHDVHVEMISVRRADRGKGYGAALTALPIACGPDVPSVLIASDDGLPIYQRLGFVPLTRFGLWMGTAG